MNRTQLANGIRVTTEHQPFFHMAHVQIRFCVGSGVERPEEMGAAHFLEHLTFAGIHEMNGFEFTCRMADIGAIVSATTGRDHTTYQIDVPCDHLLKALRLFLQLVTHPEIDPERVETERSVILSEHEIVEDDLFEKGLDLFHQHMVGEYGHPVLGTEESISKLDASTLQNFRNRYYTPDNLIIGVAGNVDHEQVVAEIEATIGQWRGTSDQKVKPTVRTEYHRLHVQQDSDSVHMYWGFAAPNRHELDRSAFAVMTKTLAGDGTDMWSHLFHLVRTQLGLAYSIGGDYFFLDELGMYFFTLITRPDCAAEVIEIVEREMKRFQNGELPLQTLRAISTCSSGIRALEDTLSGRVTRLVEREVFAQPFQSVTEECMSLARTTEEDVSRVAQMYLQPRLLITLGTEVLT